MVDNHISASETKTLRKCPYRKYSATALNLPTLPAEPIILPKNSSDFIVRTKRKAQEHGVREAAFCVKCQPQPGRVCTQGAPVTDGSTPAGTQGRKLGGAPVRNPSHARRFHQPRRTGSRARRPCGDPAPRGLPQAHLHRLLPGTAPSGRSGGAAQQPEPLGRGRQEAALGCQLGKGLRRGGDLQPRRAHPAALTPARPPRVLTPAIPPRGAAGRSRACGAAGRADCRPAWPPPGHGSAASGAASRAAPAGRGRETKSKPGPGPRGSHHEQGGRPLVREQSASASRGMAVRGQRAGPCVGGGWGRREAVRAQSRQSRPWNNKQCGSGGASGKRLRGEPVRSTSSLGSEKRAPSGCQKGGVPARTGTPCNFSPAPSAVRSARTSQRRGSSAAEQ